MVFLAWFIVCSGFVRSCVVDGFFWVLVDNVYGIEILLVLFILSDRCLKVLNGSMEEIVEE